MSTPMTRGLFSTLLLSAVVFIVGIGIWVLAADDHHAPAAVVIGSLMVLISFITLLVSGGIAIGRRRR